MFEGPTLHLPSGPFPPVTHTSLPRPSSTDLTSLISHSLGFTSLAYQRLARLAVHPPMERPD